MAVLIDTHKAIGRLVEKGIRKAEAEAFVEVFSEGNDQVATKADLRELELRIINQLTNRLIGVVGVATAVLALLKFLG